jgi:hypothetical protein
MNPRSSDTLELIDPVGRFQSKPDTRPRMPEPPPVKLVTVTDATLLTGAGREVQLDEFYVGMLRFLRVPPRGRRFYRAENFDLVFDVLEPPVLRDSLRPLGVEVPSLAAVEHELVERQIEFIRQRGLLPGHDNLLLQDPAGNWVALTESRLI